jgi:hypothetical protein
MSAAEIYDRTSAVSPDYNYTLTLKPQGIIEEVSNKNGIIHLGVDGSEERINFNTTSIFYLNYEYKQLSESDSGLIFDLYNDPAKANGCQRSFYITYGDGHTYTCRFDCKLTRKGNSVTRYGLPGISLKILGHKND